MATTITLDGVAFTDTDFLVRGHLTPTTVNGTAYPRFQAMWVAGLREIDTKVGQVGGLGVAMAYAAETGSTADAAPGDGKLTWNNATQASATVIYLDAQDANGTDLLTLIDTLDDSTSTIKGTLRLTKVSDNSAWILYNLTAVTTASGYRKLTVAAVSYSATSPFADGDALSLSFSRTGDMGTSIFAGDFGATANFTNEVGGQPAPDFRYDEGNKKLYIRSLIVTEEADTPDLALRRVNGSLTAPTALSENDVIGVIYWQPWLGQAAWGSGSPNYARTAQIQARLTEDSTGISNGKSGGILEIAITPIGSDVLRGRAWWGADGKLALLGRGALEDGSYNSLTWAPLGALSALVGDTANEAAVSLRHSDDATEGYDLDLTHTGNVATLYRVVGSTRTAALGINANGVGIGADAAASPATTLHVAATTTTVRIRSTGDGNDVALHLQADNLGGTTLSREWVLDPDADTLRLDRAGTTQLVVETDGTLDLKKAGSAAATPGNFSADNYAVHKVAGTTVYIPYMTGSW